MKKSVTHGLLIGCLFGILITAGLLFIYLEHHRGQSLGVSTTIKTIPLKQFDQTLFTQNIKRGLNEQKQVNQKIKAAVIPHHDTAGMMIANLLLTAKNQNISKLIIVGPNHQELGNAQIQTTTDSWETPFGMVKNNKQNTDNLSSIAKNTETEIFFNEQSIYTLLPYIKTILPDAEVSVLILKRNISPEQEQQIAQTLAQMSDDQTLILGSVDFSHYLSRTVAEQKDRETLEIINQRDYKKLALLSSDFLDSPSTISVILQTMNLLNNKTIEVIDHKNSDELRSENTGNTTSYYQLIFY